MFNFRFRKDQMIIPLEALKILLFFSFLPFVPRPETNWCQPGKYSEKRRLLPNEPIFATNRILNWELIRQSEYYCSRSESETHRWQKPIQVQHKGSARILDQTERNQSTKPGPGQILLWSHGALYIELSSPWSNRLMYFRSGSPLR